MLSKNKAVKAIIFIIISAFLVINIYENAYLSIFQNNYNKTFNSSVKQYNLSITEFLSNLESAVEMLSQSEMIQYVSDNPETYYDSTLNLLKIFNQSYSSTAFAYFAPEKKLFGSKKLVSWPDTSEQLSNTSWEAAERPWYINTINSNDKITWTKPYVDSTTNKYVITVSKVVIDKENSFKGVMAIDIYLDDLSDKINDFKKYNQGDMIIILKTDMDNFSIIDDTENKNLSSLFNNKVIDSMYSTESGILYSDSKAGDYYISYDTNLVTGWKLVGVIDKYKLTKDTTNLVFNLLIGIIALLVISTICVLYIKKQMGSTIQKLSGSIIHTEEKTLPPSSTIKLFQMESEDIVLEKTTSDINLLFKIESEKERIHNLTKNNSKFTSSDAKGLNISLTRLAGYSANLNPSLKSHEIQLVNINNLLFEVQEYVNSLRQKSISIELETELIHLDVLINSILEDAAL